MLDQRGVVDGQERSIVVRGGRSERRAGGAQRVEQDGGSLRYLGPGLPDA